MKPRNQHRDTSVCHNFGHADSELRTVDRRVVRCCKNCGRTEYVTDDEKFTGPDLLAGAFRGTPQYAEYRKNAERLAWLNAQDFMIQTIKQDGEAYMVLYIGGRRWRGPTIEDVIDQARSKEASGGR